MAWHGMAWHGMAWHGIGQTDRRTDGQTDRRTAIQTDSHTLGFTVLGSDNYVDARTDGRTFAASETVSRRWSCIENIFQDARASERASERALRAGDGNT